MTGQRLTFFDKKTETFEQSVSPVFFFTECEHFGPECFRIALYGHTQELRLKAEYKQYPKGKGDPGWCNVECPYCYYEQMKAFSVRCCMCGYGIFPGDGVALHDAAHSDIHDDAVFVDGKAVGCLLWSCGLGGPKTFSARWGFGRLHFPGAVDATNTREFPYFVFANGQEL